MYYWRDCRLDYRLIQLACILQFRPHFFFLQFFGNYSFILNWQLATCFIIWHSIPFKVQILISMRLKLLCWHDLLFREVLTAHFNYRSICILVSYSLIVKTIFLNFNVLIWYNWLFLNFFKSSSAWTLSTGSTLLRVDLRSRLTNTWSS